MSLIVENICKNFGSTTILKQISFCVNPGKIFVLMGVCGAGKTTLLRIITGLDKEFSGKITLNNQCLNDVPTEKRNIAMLFQQAALFPHLNVEDNLKFTLRGVSSKDVKTKTQMVIEEFRLEPFLHRYPYNLSGGESQRIAIARIFLRAPELILLDEPFSHLDSLSQYELAEKVKHIGKVLNIPVVYVTHNQKDALLADYIAMLVNGEILQQGLPKELYDYPNTKEIASFLGDLPVNFIDGKIENGFFTANKDKQISFPANKEKDRYVCACLRPQHISLSQDNGETCNVSDVSFCGQGFLVTVKFQTITLKVFSMLDTWRKGMEAKVTFNIDKISYL